MRRHHRQRRLESDNPIGRIREFALLFVVMVRSVIRGHEVDRAVTDRLLECGDIIRGAQRRVHLGIGLVALHRVLGQRKMMRADLGGHPDPAILAPANELDRPTRAHVTQVDVPPRPPCQQDVADRHDLFRLGRNALEAEPGGDDPLVHRPAPGQRHLLTVIGHGDAEGARVFERGSHQLRRRDRLAVVAHGDRTGTDHFAKLGQRLALLPDRHGSDRVDPGRLRPQRLPDDEADGRLVVRHGIGVGHGADRRESAGRRCPGTGCNRLHVLTPRLAQVAVHVDEARRDDPARAVDDLEPPVTANLA